MENKWMCLTNCVCLIDAVGQKLRHLDKKCDHELVMLRMTTLRANSRFPQNYVAQRLYRQTTDNSQYCHIFPFFRLPHSW